MTQHGLLSRSDDMPRFWGVYGPFLAIQSLDTTMHRRVPTSGPAQSLLPPHNHSQYPLTRIRVARSA